MVSANVATEDLELLSELIEAGKVRPQIDRRYPFAEIPAAIAYLDQGRARGKVVVGVGMRDFPSPRTSRCQEDRIWSRLSWARSKHLPRSTLHARTPDVTPTVRAPSLLTFADFRRCRAGWTTKRLPGGSPDLVFH